MLIPRNHSCSLSLAVEASLSSEAPVGVGPRPEVSPVTAWDDKHERVHCLRCGERFLCKVNSPSRCDCVDVQLTSGEMEYILPLADGECLCPNCLDSLRTDYRAICGS